MKQVDQKTINLILLFVVAMTGFSCTEQDTAWFPVVGAGIIQTEYRTVSSFTKVKCLIRGDLLVQRSPEQKLSVEAQENLLSLLETEVVEGTLYISFGTHAIETDSLVNVHISIPEINELTMSGTGDVISDFGIPAINLSGSGNVKCIGEIDQVTVKLSGTGNVNLDEMKVKKAQVNISGNGNVSLNVSDELNVAIPGTGLVYYRGIPTIQKNITGYGLVIEKK